MIHELGWQGAIDLAKSICDKLDEEGELKCDPQLQGNHASIYHFYLYSRNPVRF